MVLESVLAWLNENQTLPSVSRAVIIDSLGETVFSLTFPLPSRGAQVFRVWLVSFIHVSSILMIILCRLSCFNITKADYYLRTSDLSELAWGLSFFALTKLNWQSALITCLTNFKLTSKLAYSFTLVRILSAVSIAYPYFLAVSTATLMAVRLS